MSAQKEESQRAARAAAAILAGRSASNPAAIMVTLEHTVATILLALYGTPEMAAAMLNEGLLPGVEQRLTLYAAGKKKEQEPAPSASISPERCPNCNDQLMDQTAADGSPVKVCPTCGATRRPVKGGDA